MFIVIGAGLLAVAFIMGIPLDLITTRVEWSQLIFFIGVSVVTYGLLDVFKSIIKELFSALTLIAGVGLAGYGTYRGDVLMIATAIAIATGWGHGVEWSKKASKKKA